MSSQKTDGRGDAEGCDTAELRMGHVGDAAAIEAVHYAAREAVYAGRVAMWPPPGPDRAGRVARWERWLSDPAIDCIVAAVADEIVGFVTIRPSADDDADPETVAEMPTLYVRPDCWRRGVGRALCSESLERAAARAFRELTLWVLDINGRARRFYEEVGLVADGVTKVDEATNEELVAHRYRIGLTDR